jgi:hypothetical protein
MKGDGGNVRLPGGTEKRSSEVTRVVGRKKRVIVARRSRGMKIHRRVRRGN